jgi:hypothetical protein
MSEKRRGKNNRTYGISCLRNRISAKTPHATATSFQSPPISSHIFSMTSSRPSRTPTISLTRSHQLSKPSCLSSSGTRSRSRRKDLTLSFHRRDEYAKSRSAEKFWRWGCEFINGINSLESRWRSSEGCLDRMSKKKTDALERPRSVALMGRKR